jgi:hypothetical protein
MTIPAQFYSVFFLIGLAVIIAYAYRQFDKPSFPNQATVPRAMEPLRYLFLKSAYGRARVTYILGVVLFYCLLVWPGKQIVPYLPKFNGSQELPPEGWALVVALIVAGFVPNFNWKPLTVIEETLRRWVHAWFLVPDGVLNTIAVLDDTSYEPPRSQLEAISDPVLRENLRNDLRLPVGSLQYRWARATMLMESLQQMGSGAAHPLKRAAFAPFQQDFEQIETSYRALASEIEDAVDSASPEAREAKGKKLIPRVESILKQIYAYISWGIRYQANTEGDVDRLLIELGFRVPITLGQDLFDIVAPAVLLVAAITAAFWLTYYIATIGSGPNIVLLALYAGITAAFMYGSAIYIALKQRGNQIDQGLWQEGSPTRLAPIALRAGLVAWFIIAVTTVVTQPSMVADSLDALWQVIKSAAGAAGAAPGGPYDWTPLPKYLLAALPWFVPGATVSVLLALTVGRNITRRTIADRRRDMTLFGLALGIAAALAQLIQNSLYIILLNQTSSVFDTVPALGLVGVACGAVIGFMVPTQCRANLVTPAARVKVRALQDLRDKAYGIMDKTAADVWIFQARDELNGITPAEAVQYKGRQTSAMRLLDNLTDGAGRTAADRSAPVVIEGGRAGAQRR